MKAETLNQILNAVPNGKVQEVCNRANKSKNTYYNVLKHRLHRNPKLVTSALDIIEEQAFEALALVKKARKELAEDIANQEAKQLKRQQKQAA